MEEKIKEKEDVISCEAVFSVDEEEAEHEEHKEKKKEQTLKTGSLRIRQAERKRNRFDPQPDLGNANVGKI